MIDYPYVNIPTSARRSPGGESRAEVLMSGIVESVSQLRFPVIYKFLLSLSLISVLLILPLMVLGNSSTNSIIRGYL